MGLGRRRCAPDLRETAPGALRGQAPFRVIRPRWCAVGESPGLSTDEGRGGLVAWLDPNARLGLPLLGVVVVRS
jgi:hypothetical protein